MFYFKILDDEYKIVFQHIHYPNPAKVEGCKNLIDGSTWARVYGQDKVPLREAIAHKTVLDKRFDKETGRKIALTRLVAYYPQVVRKHIWEAYFNRAVSNNRGKNETK